MKFFDTNQIFIHALDCANEDQRKTLNDFKNDILRRVSQTLEASKKQDQEKDDYLRRKYKEQLEQAKIAVDEKFRQAEAQREADYKKGMSVASSMNVPAAITCLTKVGDYKDAPKKLKSLMTLKETNNAIANGDSYLTERILNEQPQIVTNLQNAVIAWENRSTMGMKKWVVPILYGICIFMFLIGGNAISALSVIVGFAVGAFLLKNQPYPAFIAVGIFHTIAGSLYSSEWTIILPLVYVISIVRKKGYARNLLAKKQLKSTLDKAKEQINLYEKNIRNSIDEIWRNAICTTYDGVNMQGILAKLEQCNYLI